MDSIDKLKLKTIIGEISQKLVFLGVINKQEDASSELAGYEINKLLKEQGALEKKYGELIQKRNPLIGISNKKKLLAIQKEIMDVSNKLKESMKKLYRLFKENPDLKKDEEKIDDERRDLIINLEELLSSLNENKYENFELFLFKELESQDLLRQNLKHEKELMNEIRKLTADRKREQADYQNEISEKQKDIQSLKEKLVNKTNRAEIKKKYIENESKADEGTRARNFDQEEKEYETQIELFKNKIKTENLVHSQLKECLIRKEQEIRKKGEERNKKHDTNKDNIDKEKEKLLDQKAKDLEKLEKLRKRFENDKLLKQQKEIEENKKGEENKEKNIKEIKINNAITLIQQEYLK